MFLQKYQVILRRGQGDMWQYTAHAQFSLLLSNAALLLCLLESLRTSTFPLALSTSKEDQI